MAPSLDGKVMVITGASSGIGRSTARYCASQGAAVVLSSRRPRVLRDLAREIRRAGGTAAWFAADVTSVKQLRALAAFAVRRFGRVDVWVNNAGVFLQGRVQDISLDEYRRVLEVDFLGLVNGTQRALEVMLPRHSGVIVQVSSVAAKRPVPYTSAYSAAKAAIDGFTGAVRSELAGSGVRLSILYPPTVDTPIYDNARGKLGRRPRPAPPVADPIEAAKAIARLATSGRRFAYFGWARPLATLDALAPALGDRLLHRASSLTHTSGSPGRDTIDAPRDRASVSARSGWRDQGWRGLEGRDVVRVLPVGSAGVGLLTLALGYRLLRRFRNSP